MESENQQTVEFQMEPELKANILDFLTNVYDIGKIKDIMNEERLVYSEKEMNLLTSLLGKFPAHVVYDLLQKLSSGLKSL